MADNFSNIMRGAAEVYIGTSNGTPSTHLGTTSDDGVDVSIEYEKNELRSGSYLQAVKRYISGVNIKVKFTLAESTTTNLDYVLPAGACATDLASALVKEKSLKVVGTDPDTSATRTLSLGNGTFTANFDCKFKVAGVWLIPCEFESLQATAAPTLVDA